MPGGRPPKYKTVEALQTKIDDYFDNPPTRKVTGSDGMVKDVPVMTVCGLVLHLGFCDRQSFYDYGNRSKFSCTIKKARLRIENDYEMQLRTSTAGQARIIFALKNLGWRDRVETKVSGSLANNLTVTFVVPSGYWAD